MGRIIVITSGKGGVGKTTVTASLGVALSSMGKKVMLIEGDIGLNNLDVALGLEDRIAYDLTDVMLGRCKLRQAIISPQGFGNLKVLPSVHSLAENTTGYEFKSICQTVAEDSDFVLIDCPAGVEQGFYRAVRAAREAILVTTPHISAVRDVNKALGLLNGYGVDILGVAVNRTRADLVKHGVTISPEELAELLRLHLVAVLPEDDEIGVSGSLLLGANKQSMMAYRLFAQSIITDKFEVLDITNQHFGILNKRKV